MTDAELGEDALFRSDIMLKYLRPNADPLAALSAATLLLMRLYYGYCNESINDFAERVRAGIIKLDENTLRKNL